MIGLFGSHEDGGLGLTDRVKGTAAELFEGDLTWTGHLDRSRWMSQKTVVIEGGSVGDTMRLLGEESADGERDILERRPGCPATRAGGSRSARARPGLPGPHRASG